MKKRRRTSKLWNWTSVSIVLVVATIIILIVGKTYFNKEVKSNTNIAEAKSNPPAPTVQTVQVQNKKQIIESLHNTMKQKGTLKLSTLGSSGTLGTGVKPNEFNKTWVSQLYSYLKTDEGLSKLEYTNNGFSGYTTRNIIQKNKVDEIIKQNPDIVIFETCLIYNYSNDVSMDTTIKDIDTIVSTIKEKLPQAVVIVQSSNPIKNQGKNGVGLTYQDYLNKTKEYAASKNWNYIDIQEGINNKVKEAGKNTNDILADGIHVNETGYNLWFQTIKDYLQMH